MKRNLGRNGDDESAIQLATRIPKGLHKAVKLHIVRTDQRIQTFVAEALRDKLAKEGKRHA